MLPRGLERATKPKRIRCEVTVAQKIKRMTVEELKLALQKDKAIMQASRNYMVKGCARTRIRKIEAELTKRKAQEA